jgi:Ca2+-binding EF-hand superfamily protein
MEVFKKFDADDSGAISRTELGEAQWLDRFPMLDFGTSIVDEVVRFPFFVA